MTNQPLSKYAEQSRTLAVQCLNCNQLGECGEEKQYLIRGDGLNCDNFGGTITPDK